MVTQPVQPRVPEFTSLLNEERVHVSVYSSRKLNTVRVPYAVHMLDSTKTIKNGKMLLIGTKRLAR